MAPSLADKKRLKMIALGATTGSLADLERQYYSGVSGLPAQRSITDHRRAFYIAAATAPVVRSINDLEFLYWIFVIPGNNVGSEADRGMVFYV